MRKSKGVVGPKGHKLVRGIGVNDADYPVFLRLENGKVWQCPIHRNWSNMLTRCTSEEGKYSYDYSKEHNETYVGVTVCEEWKSFMKFREWALTRNWEGNQLDKDIIGDGTLYSPETCDYVPSKVNMILHRKSSSREGLWGVGKHGKNFTSSVFFEGEKLYDGTFDTELEAHRLYQKHKSIVIKMAAEKWLFEGEISLLVYEHLKKKAMKMEDDYINNRITYHL